MGNKATNPKKRIKIWDIVPKFPLRLQPVFQPKPKNILPMADIVVSRPANKFSANRSFFFFSFGQFLIPRLLLRFLALLLVILLAGTPAWPILADDLVDVISIVSEADGPGVTLDANKEIISEEQREEQMLENKKIEDEADADEAKGENEEAETKGPEWQGESENKPALETKNIEEEINNYQDHQAQQGQQEQEKQEEMEEQNAVSEGESEEESMVDLSMIDKDIYERIRRDLDSEWRGQMEEYRKKAERMEEELRSQQNLWGETLRQTLTKEIKKELNQKCLKLEDAGYYCLVDRTNENNLLSKFSPVNFNESFAAPKEIFSLKDPEKGNREIYLKENEISRRLTNNDYDDIFPALDIFGNLAVWQTFVGNHWQIFVYDLSSDVLKQLTDLDFNNMNPQIHNGRIVWQSWQNDNWEILIAERKNNDCFLQDNCWIVRQLTNNQWHDMFPKVAGDSVVWQVFQNNTWQLMVYNLKTGFFSRLTQEKEKSENPRFAVVWESRQAGQRKYFAYDLSSGELTEIKPGNEEPFDGGGLPQAPFQENIIAAPVVSSPIRPGDVSDENLGESEE